MSRRLGERRKRLKVAVQRLEEYNRLRCFLIIEQTEWKDGL